MLINVNDYFIRKAEGSEKKPMTVQDKVRANGAIAAKSAFVAVTIMALNCGPAPEKETAEVGVGGKEYGNVAHAAVPSGSGGVSGESSQDLITPDNPSRVVLRLKREQVEEVADILLTKYSGEKFPYEYSVVRDEAGMVVIATVPQGEATQVALIARDANGDAIGKATRLVLEPETKQGTKEIVLWGTQQTVHFPADVEKQLVEGQTVLQDPITLEYLDTDREVLHGIFRAPIDGAYRVKCVGSKRVHHLINGILGCESDSFDIQLLAGQELALYPEVTEEQVCVQLDTLPPLTDEE